jgi:hypothetical protein
MGRKIGWVAALVLFAAATPALADGLVVEKARATFASSRRGLPKHAISVRGIVTSVTTVDAFDPARHGVRIKLGEFVAVAHQPGEEASAFKFRRHAWRLRTKVNGVKTKLKLDVRSGRISVNVKGANAFRLRDAGPQYVECTIEVGTAVLGQALVFDERGRGSATKWISLAQGVPVAPPGTPPIGTRPPQGTLVYEILRTGEVSTVLQPGVQVARNQEQWDALFEHAALPTHIQPPGVDFKQDMVIGVFMGLVSQIHEQRIEITAITDTADQLHVSWRSRYGCFQFACSGGLNDPNACPDFAPYMFVRVRRVDSLEVSNRGASVYDDCK